METKAKTQEILNQFGLDFRIEKLPMMGKLFVGNDLNGLPMYKEIKSSDYGLYNTKSNEIINIVKEGYTMDQMIDIYRGFIKAAALDVLLLDTHPGINETTLFSITVADLLLMILRPDRQDYQGTAVTVDVARKLGVPDLRLLMNKALTSLDWQNLKATIESTYQAPCLGILAQNDDIMRYGGSGLFSQQEPSHPFTIQLKEVVSQLRPLIAA